MKRPLLPVASAYVGGVLVGAAFSVPLAGLLGVALAVGWGAVALARARPWLVWVLLVLAGWTHMTLRQAVLSPVDLRLVLGDTAAIVTLHARLAATPTHRIRERDTGESWRSMAVLAVDAVAREGRWEPAHGRVAATTPDVLSAEFYAGQAVEVEGVLRVPRGPLAAGLFDYRAHLRWLGIYHQLEVGSTNDWRLRTPPEGAARRPWGDRFCGWAQRTMARGLPAEDEPVRLLWAMTLGWKTALTEEVSEPFMRSGTMHIFAISGLHIALIALVLVAVLRVLQMPRAACGWVVVPLLWFYTSATGWQPSAIRASLMMTVVVLGWALYRPTDLLNSLAAAAFLILLWEPRQLFQAGFQLSFFVVLSIALILPPVRRGCDRLLQTDPLLPPELVPVWRRRLDAPLRYLASSVATSLAAWLGSLPLIAHYFHLVTPVSLLVNLVAVPLAGLALAANLGSLLCAVWAPGLTELFNHSAWLWMAVLIRLCEWAVTLPGACFHVRGPSLPGLLVYYGLLIGIGTGWLLARGRRRWFALALGLAAVWLAADRWHSRSRTTLLFPPVQAGAAVFVDAPGRANDLLIDCGSERGAPYLLQPLLQSLGVNRLARILLTHGDARHVGGAPVIRARFRAVQIVTSPVRFRSPVYRRALAELEADPPRRMQVQRGDAVAGWRVLHPLATDSFSLADDAALVLRAEVHGVRVLLLSDLARAGQTALLDRGGDLRADVVVTGLPSRGEPLIDDLLAAIQPAVVIVQDGESPAYERAGGVLRERLARYPATILYTSEAGTVTLRVGRGRWQVRTMTD